MWLASGPSHVCVHLDNMASTSASTSACDVSAEIDSEESSFDNDEQERTEQRDTTMTSEASSI